MNNNFIKLPVTSLDKNAKSRIDVALSRITGSQNAKLRQEQESVLAFCEQPENSSTNLLVALSTSAGKTVIYQLLAVLPSAETKQIIVVVPLNALAHQVYEVLQRFTSALLLAGDATRESREHANDDLTTTLSNVKPNQLAQARVIVMVPEALVVKVASVNNYFESMKNNDLNIYRFVLDEAHLLCLWLQFRSAYQDVLELMKCIKAPKLLLSATISQKQFELIRLWCSPIEKQWCAIVGSMRRSDISIELRNECDFRIVCECLKTNNNSVIVACSTFELIRQLVDFVRAYPDTVVHSSKLVVVFNGTLSCNERMIALQNLPNAQIVYTNQAGSHGINVMNVTQLILVGAFDSCSMVWQLLSRGSRNGSGAKVLWMAEQTHFSVVKRLLTKDANWLKDDCIPLLKRSDPLCALRTSQLLVVQEQIEEVKSMKALFRETVVGQHREVQCVQNALLQNCISSPSIGIDCACNCTPSCIFNFGSRVQQRSLSLFGLQLYRDLRAARDTIVATNGGQSLYATSHALAPDSLLLAVALDCNDGRLQLHDSRVAFESIKKIFNVVQQQYQTSPPPPIVAAALAQYNYDNNDDDDNDKQSQQTQRRKVYAPRRQRTIMHNCGHCRKTLTDDPVVCTNCCKSFHGACEPELTASYLLHDVTVHICFSCSKTRSAAKPIRFTQ